jgi:hypothetical protein
MSGDLRFWYLFGGIWLVVGVCFVAASLGVNLFADPAQLNDGTPSGCLPRSASPPPWPAASSSTLPAPPPRATGGLCGPACRSPRGRLISRLSRFPEHSRRRFRRQLNQL